MPEPRPETLDFLLTRRSRPAKTLTGPAPDRTDLGILLSAAARTPDHGMLVPWRFLVIEKAALARLAGLAAERAREIGKEDGDVEKVRSVFANAPLIVAVIASPKPSEKIPQIEQTLSAGAVCLSLLNAALAAGWGANWLTGWTALDRPFLQALGLVEGEFVAGYMHIGTESVVPAERARPDLEAITGWLEA